MGTPLSHVPPRCDNGAVDPLAPDSSQPSVSVIIPVYNDTERLLRCLEALEAQTYPRNRFEVIVVDNGSDVPVADTLNRHAGCAILVTEPRPGGFVARNAGIERASGEILAYINCDEQYLPGALRQVADFFTRHPAVDVLFANTVIVNSRGEYLCHREPLVPAQFHIWVSGNLPVLTCATFFRRRIIQERHLFFDPHLKDVGDVTWVMRLLEARLQMAVFPEFTSVFTETGANMNLLPNARREKERLYASAPAWVRAGRPLWLAHHRLRRLLAGHYRTRPFSFSLFTESSPDRRVTHHISRPTYRWVRGAAL